MRLLSICFLFSSFVYAASVPMSQMGPLRYKVVVLGEAGVGKSSLTVRLANGVFPESLETTTGAAFIPKMLEVEGRAVKFEVWDTAGQERYNSLIPLYYRGSRAALVVYDLTNKASYERAQKWVQQLAGEPSMGVMALFGNKLDLEGERQVNKEEASQYAAQEGLLFFEGSARSGEYIEEAFNEMARRLVKAEIALVKQMAGGDDGQMPPGVSPENSEILLVEHRQRQERRQCGAGSIRCCH